MTSYRQIEANRRNALKSIGPRTEAGKEASRCNAVRHGLTAETVISALEDAEDYKAFEATITADYAAQSAVERKLVLRLAGLLWRPRRATTIETGLFEIQADHLSNFRMTRPPASREIVYALFNANLTAIGNCLQLRGRVIQSAKKVPWRSLQGGHLGRGEGAEGCQAAMRQKGAPSLKKLERAKGIEPSTYSLGSCRRALVLFVNFPACCIHVADNGQMSLPSARPRPHRSRASARSPASACSPGSLASGAESSWTLRTRRGRCALLAKPSALAKTSRHFRSNRPHHLRSSSLRAPKSRAALSTLLPPVRTQRVTLKPA